MTERTGERTGDRRGAARVAAWLDGPVPLAALFVDGRLEDLRLAPDPAEGPQPGEVHAVQVDRLTPARRGGRASAFLRAGAGAMLYLADAAGLAPGDRLTVEVLREAEDGKAARAAQRLTLLGRWMAHTPGAPGVNVSKKIADPDRRAALQAAVAPFAATGGFVLRTRAAAAEPEALSEEARRLSRDAAGLLAAPLDPPRRLRAAPGPAERSRADWGLEPIDLRLEPGLARRALEAVEALGAPRAGLPGPGGAWISIEPTAALVAIDVNSGDAPALLPVNLAAMREIPRQLRLRGLGGIVAIDCAPAAPADRSRMLAGLGAAADAAFEAKGFGPAGLIEAVRRRDRPPLGPRLARVVAALAEAAGEGEGGRGRR